MEEVTLTVTTENLNFSYKNGQAQTEAIRDLNISVKEGEFVSFIGPSGCGKTTLLRLLANILEPTSGTLVVNGQTPEEARRRQDSSFVFQEPALLEWRTALKNVALPLELSGRKTKGEIRNIARGFIELVGLDGFEDHFPRQLSGGMKQRVSIARALTMNPHLLLMDEPFAALDAITRHRMNFELLRIWSATKATILFVTHNIREAVLLSDRVFVFRSRPGRLMEIIDIDLARPRTNQTSDSAAFNDLHVQGEMLLEEAINDVE